ncbi:zinc finger and SCAN domain containing 29, partial [Chelydra serpentina]
GGLPIRLTKMGPGDDPEAFLVTFERVATATQWPLEHWATILAPYLTGSAQAAYRNLDPQEALQYEKVKAAILDRTGISTETYRQRLRREKYPPGARPRAVAQKVLDLCWRWLEPKRRTSCQVAEAVALKQFLRILPTRGKEWVQRHRLKTLAEATSLVEDFMAVEPEEQGGLKTRTSGGGDR